MTKTPPHNIEAEKSVIGSLLLDNDLWVEISLILQKGDFYSPSHQKIYETLEDLHRKSQPIDAITVANKLQEVGRLEEVGGHDYLAALVDDIPTIAHAGAYAEIVKENSTLRTAIKASQGFIGDAYGKNFENMKSFLDRYEAEIFALGDQRNENGLVSAKDVVHLSIEKLEQLAKNQGDITGVPSGFEEVDRMTAGFQPGELIIVAARPSMGKTAFSLNMAMHATLRNSKSVAFFSVEMNKESLMSRVIGGEAGVRLSDLRLGKLADKDWTQVFNTASVISETKLFVDDTSGVTPFEIRSKSRRLKKSEHGLDMIVVDYLQLMTTQQKVESREREVSEISRHLKGIAKELGVPVIALAQLNRGVEGRSDRRPLLSDLRESGSIEQDADVIMMLYREDYYDKDNPEVRGVAEVIINKQRNGPTGTVRLRWNPDYGRFSNYIDQPEVPLNIDPGPQSIPPTEGDGLPNYAPRK